MLQHILTKKSDTYDTRAVQETTATLTKKKEKIYRSQSGATNISSAPPQRPTQHTLHGRHTEDSSEAHHKLWHLTVHSIVYAIELIFATYVTTPAIPHLCNGESHCRSDTIRCSLVDHLLSQDSARDGIAVNDVYHYISRLLLCREGLQAGVWTVATP